MTKALSAPIRAALLLCGLALLAGCGSAPPPKDPQLVINLRWVQNYPGERRSGVDTGLYWALSFLGARLPAGARVLTWHGNIVSIDLEAAGVADETKTMWKKYLQVLRASAEYRAMGGVDIGRFVLLGLCSPAQYYALTGVAPTFQEFQARHSVGSREFAVSESGVAHGNRLIDIQAAHDLGTTTFVGYEGKGSIKDRTFTKAEIETLEFMPNGQLRFGLYDLQGNRVAATSPELTTAGKPSKCLWCHEIRLLPPFRNVTDVTGYYTTREFRALVDGSMQRVDGYRRTLESKTDFTHLNDHSYAEYLYQSFAEPSAARLALEWNMPVDAVIQKLNAVKLKTHGDKELAALGPDFAGSGLYDRSDVDALAPYAVIRTPTSSREPSAYEPDLLH